MLFQHNAVPTMSFTPNVHLTHCCSYKIYRQRIPSLHHSYKTSL